MTLYICCIYAPRSSSAGGGENGNGDTITVATSALAKIASATIMKGAVKSALWTLDLTDTMSIIVRPCRFQHSSRYVQIKEISEDGFSRVVNVSDYNFVKVFNSKDRRVEMSANSPATVASNVDISNVDVGALPLSALLALFVQVYCLLTFHLSLPDLDSLHSHLFQFSHLGEI
jgi:hypothetical protein